MSSANSLPRPTARRFLRLGVLVGLVYLLIVGVVAGLEYRSEMSKIDRGFFSDTFPPTAFTQLATLPLSLAVSPGLAGYPDAFDEEVFREVVRSRLTAFLLVAVLQAAVLGLLTGLWPRLTGGSEVSVPGGDPPWPPSRPPL